MSNAKSRVEELSMGLTSLQNRYREMEAEIRLTNDDSVQTIKMQRQKINQLRGNNTRVKEELELETRQARVSLKKTGSTTISSLQDQGDYFERKYQTEKQKTQDLHILIKNMEENILQQRSDMGGVNANRETSRTIQKNIRMLENRLDKALVKYNEALGHNKKLRETIDNLRRDRAVFDGIYNKLQMDLEHKKSEMSKIMDDAMTAYEARTQAQVEMVKIKEQGDKEVKQFEKEWKDLNRMIEENQKKTVNESQGRHSIAYKGAVDTVVEEEKDLKKRLSRGTLQVINDKIVIEKTQEEVKYYREAFKKIREATGIENIDELAQNFEDADKENFKLFNEANKLNKDIEHLELQINSTKEQIEKAKTTMFSADSTRKQILDNLNKRLETTETKIQSYDEKYNNAMDMVDSLKNGIRDVLLCMDADREDPTVIERVDTVGINESNLMEFLAVIEKRTDSLIQEYLSQDAERASAFVQPTDIANIAAEEASLGVGVGKISEEIMIIPPTTLTGFEGESDLPI